VGFVLLLVAVAGGIYFTQSDRSQGSDGQNVLGPTTEIPAGLKPAKPSEVRADITSYKPLKGKELYFYLRITNLTNQRRFIRCRAKFLNSQGQVVADYPSASNYSPHYTLKPAGQLRVDFGSAKAVTATRVTCETTR
jgi:hypothetical protein